MMTTDMLETMVPSLEMCSRLREGEFGGSMLEWLETPGVVQATGLNYALIERGELFSPWSQGFPAPNAQEIMDALVAMENVWNVSVRHSGHQGYVARCRMVVIGSRGQKLPGEWRQGKGSTMANALLDLWLKING